jgi:hypothetical protein
MMSECSAGAAFSTCKGVFNQHSILSINKIIALRHYKIKFLVVLITNDSFTNEETKKGISLS